MDALEYNVQKHIDYWMVHKWSGGRMPEVSYKVTTNRQGGLECGCPAGRYHNHCKHADMVRAFIKAEKDGKLDEGLIMFFKV